MRSGERMNLLVNMLMGSEKQQVKAEMKVSAKNMAAASMVTSGIVSGIMNMFSVFKDEKELTEALKDVGVDVAKSGVRGGATGALWNCH